MSRRARDLAIVAAVIAVPVAILAGVILIGTDQCIKNSPVGCNHGSLDRGWAGAWLLFGGLGVIFAAALIAKAPGSLPKQAPRAPHDNRRYTYPVRAVTPRGTTVAMKCCRYGHRTADQAKAHAGLVAQRVRMTGR